MQHFLIKTPSNCTVVEFRRNCTRMALSVEKYSGGLAAVYLEPRQYLPANTYITPLSMQCLLPATSPFLNKQNHHNHPHHTHFHSSEIMAKTNLFLLRTEKRRTWSMVNGHVQLNHSYRTFIFQLELFDVLLITAMSPPGTGRNEVRIIHVKK